MEINQNPLIQTENIYFNHFRKLTLFFRFNNTKIQTIFLYANKYKHLFQGYINFKMLINTIKSIVNIFHILILKNAYQIFLFNKKIKEVVIKNH